MTVKLDFHVSRKLRTTIVAKYSGYDIRAGVIDRADRPHLSALNKKVGLTSVSGGPARRRGAPRTPPISIGKVARFMFSPARWLRGPFQNDRSKDMVAFKRELLSFFAGMRKSRSQAETALRAVVRNPILQKRYGRNSRAWAKVKGFNRKLIDTGQVFQSIVGRIRKAKKATNV